MSQKFFARHLAWFAPRPWRARGLLRRVLQVCAVLLVALLPASGASAALANLKLSGETPPATFIMPDWNISADNRYVVFSSDARQSGKYELYSVPLAGRTLLRISGPVADNQDVYRPKISTIDGVSRYVVYLIQQDLPVTQNSLWSVPIGGGEAVPLFSSTETGWRIHNFTISPDGKHVVYDLENPARSEGWLNSVPVTGGHTVTLDYRDGEFIHFPFFRVTPDSSRVVYALEVETSWDDLYAVPITGGTQIPLGSDVGKVAITSDSRKAVFTHGFTSPFRLSVVDITAGESSARVLVETLHGGEFAVSASGERVVFTNQAPSDLSRRLYSIPLAGGSPVELSQGMPAGRNVWQFQITPDGTGVVFTADGLSAGVDELFGVAIGGGTPLRINHPLVSGGDVEEFAIAPNSKSVAYLADQDTDGVYELYGWTAPAGPAVKLNSPLVAGGNVQNFAILLNSLGVIYTADQDVDNQVELYGKAAGATVIRLNGSMPVGGDIQEYALLPDSSGVVYRANQQDAAKHELFATFEQMRPRVYLPAVLR